MGKPLIHKRDDVYLADVYPELYPMINASSADAVFNGLQKVVHHKDTVAEIGQKGKQWFQKYCVENPLKEIRCIIEEKQKTVHV
jgi:hypothetical protein